MLVVFMYEKFNNTNVILSHMYPLACNVRFTITDYSIA